MTVCPGYAVPVPSHRARWLATFVLAIAAAACRKGSLMADAGATLPMGRAGQSGLDGGVGHAGGRSGAGGNDDGGATGLGQCTGGGAAVCTPAGVAGPTGGVVGGFCTM